MNILVLNWRDMLHPQAGGAEVHFQQIFSRFVKNGHTVYLLTTRFAGCKEQDVQDGIIVYRWGSTFTFNWEAPFLIRKMQKRHAVDCIIDDVNKIPFFTPRWFPRVRCGVIFHHLFGRTIFTQTAFPMALYVLFLERLSGWAYRNIPCCTVSQSTAQELVEQGFAKDKIRIIENSVDTVRYSPEAAVTKQPGMILYAGRLKKYKNIGIVLTALAALRQLGRDVRFTVAGTGDDEAALRSMVKKLGLDDVVEFLGFVDEDTKIKLYRTAMVFVNPSHKEGWGITSIEAGACGTAVVANNVAGLRDSVRHNETGLLYKENDCDDLIRCITQLLDDQTFRNRCEKNGRAWAQKFSWEESSRRMEQWITGDVCAK